MTGGLAGAVARLARRASLVGFVAGRAAFYRDVAEMFQRGEALLGFLEGEIANAQLTRQRSRERALRIVLRRLQLGDDAGRLSTLLEGVVPAGDRLMLHAVDRASDKAGALLALADAVERLQAMRRAVLRQAAMPAVALPFCLVLVSLLSRVVLAVESATPAFVQDALWTGFNGAARAVAHGARDGAAPGLLAAAGSLAALAAALPRWTGAARLRVEGWPVFSLYRDYQAGLLFCSLAMLLRAGETLTGSLEDLARPARPWLRWHPGRVLAALDEHPTGLVEAFRRGLLSPHLLSRVATLHRSAGSFADVLVQLGTQEGDRVRLRVERAAVIASFALVGLFAGMATFLGVASITVPASFAGLMEPATLMTLKARHDAALPPP